MRVNTRYINKSTYGYTFSVFTRTPGGYIPLMECIYLVFTRMQGGVTVGDSSLLLCPLSVERYHFPLFVEDFV